MSPNPSINPSGAEAGKPSRSGSNSTGQSDRSRSNQSGARTPSEAGVDSAQTPSKEKLQETSELLNRTAKELNKNIRFNVVPEEGIVQAQVVNQQTDEILKEIPPDKIIELRKQIDAFLGLFIDELR